MGDEKLPEYVEDAFAVVIETYHAFSSGPSILTLRAAIHRYAREREAAALEKAARACADEPECPGEMPDDMYSAMQTDREVAAEAIRVGIRLTKSGIASRIRALIQKEPANG